MISIDLLPATLSPTLSRPHPGLSRTFRLARSRAAPAAPTPVATLALAPPAALRASTPPASVPHLVCHNKPATRPTRSPAPVSWAPVLSRSLLGCCCKRRYLGSLKRLWSVAAVVAGCCEVKWRWRLLRQKGEVEERLYTSCTAVENVLKYGGFTAGRSLTKNAPLLVSHSRHWFLGV